MGLEWDAIGALAEILGAIVVVVTLVYLVKELQHTQTSSLLSSGERVLSAFDDGNRLLVEDESLRESLFEEGELSKPERLQRYMFAVMKCNTWLSAQNAYDQGQISAELYAGASKDVQMVVDDWPALLDSFRKWLARYPEISRGAIFDPLRAATREESDRAEGPSMGESGSSGAREPTGPSQQRRDR
jgi:hypothetical protein